MRVAEVEARSASPSAKCNKRRGRVVGQSVAGAGTGVGGIAGRGGRPHARTVDGVGQPGSVVKGESKCVSVV